MGVCRSVCFVCHTKRESMLEDIAACIMPSAASVSHRRRYFCPSAQYLSIVYNRRHHNQAAIRTRTRRAGRRDVGQ